MSDGRVTIAVDVDGKQVTTLNGQLGQLEGNGQKASRGIKDIAISLGLVKLASAAFNVLKNSMDAAITRFDTMQKFPKVLEALGFSAEDSADAVKKLAGGIDGLPTKLNDVVSTAQRMTAITKNLNKSTDATIALNNAFLASGASTDQAARGVDQYIKMLSTGKVELDSWNTLMETMPVSLDKVANALGYEGPRAMMDLYDAMRAGDVPFSDFQNKLIELGTGTGELAELAKINSEGVATSFSNLGNAAAKGLANILDAFNELSKEVTDKSIAQNLDSLKNIINSTFILITKVIKSSTPVVKMFIDALSGVMGVAKPLTPVLIGLAAAYATLKIIQSINSLIIGTKAVMQMAALSGQALTIVTKAHLTAQVASTTATKADILAKGAQNGVITASTALVGLLTGSITLSTVATTLWTAATTAFGTAIKVLMGPIGWVTIAVGALVTAGIALFKWFNKETEAAKKLKSEQEELNNSTNQLNDAVKQSSNNRKDNISSIENSGKAYKDLAAKVTDLAAKENKSAAEKNLLKSSIEQLNGSVDGLNLAYDAENDKLSMSADLIKARMDAFGEQEKVNESQKALVEILEQQHEVEGKLKETTALREEWNQKLADGSVKKKEAKEATEALDQQEQALKETQVNLQAEYTNTQATLESSMAAVTAATENGTFSQVVSYETLSEAQKTAVDGMRDKWQEYSDQATEMFDTLSDKQDTSVAQMTANLEENQRVIGTWADNIATLADRGIDDGLLEKLREAGPESAGHVAAMVASSDEELNKLSEAFSKGGETATTALGTAFNTGNAGVNESIMSMVTAAKETLSGSIQSADFGSIGKNLPEGLTQGIKDGASSAINAIGQVADDGSTEFKSRAGINSPSRVFKEHGKFLTDGLVEGVKGGLGNVKSSIDGLYQVINAGMQKVVNLSGNTARQIPSAFSGLSGEMSTIGSQAMQGLAIGINNGSGSALAAAESVASQIKSKIKGALDIHSPSRWMRDQVGRFIPQGIAVGIEADADTAFKAMDSLALGLTKSISPELALGANNIGSSGLDAVNNYYTTNNGGSQSDNSEVVGLLKKLVNKDTVLVVKEDVLAKVVDRRQANNLALRNYQVE